MELEDNQQIARAFVQLTKRAETADPATLVQTFVDISTLLPSISTRDNQVLFGRRGTGKTHALVYTLEIARAAGSSTVYVDLRSAGSSGSIYSNTRLPITERATRLLLDVLGFVHNELTSTALVNESIDLSIMGPLLDALAHGISEVCIEGDISVEHQESSANLNERTNEASLGLSSKPSVSISNSSKDVENTSESKKTTESGQANHRLHFGSLSRALKDIVQVLPRRELIIALDEWVTVPYDLQPYLADLLRRALFPLGV